MSALDQVRSDIEANLPVIPVSCTSIHTKECWNTKCIPYATPLRISGALCRRTARHGSLQAPIGKCFLLALPATRCLGGLWMADTRAGAALAYRQHTTKWIKSVKVAARRFWWMALCPRGGRWQMILEGKYEVGTKASWEWGRRRPCIFWSSRLKRCEGSAAPGPRAATEASRGSKPSGKLWVGPTAPTARGVSVV